LNGDISVLDEFNPGKPARVIMGHGSPIESITYQSSFDRFFTASSDGKIVGWERQSGNNIGIAGTKHTGKVIDVCVSGNSLISIAIDGTYKWIDLNQPIYPAGIKLPSQPSAAAAAGGFAFIACREHVVTLQDGKIIQTLATKAEPTCISVSGDGHTVVVGGTDKNLYVYSQSGGKLTESRKTSHNSPLSSCSASSDGSLVAGGDSGKQVYVWKGTNKVSDASFGHNATVNCMEFSPDGQFLATGSLDSSFHIYSISDNKLVVNQQRASVGGVKDLCWVSNRTIITTGQDIVTRSWNLNL